jgi:hypothetical protein
MERASSNTEQYLGDITRVTNNIGEEMVECGNWHTYLSNVYGSIEDTDNFKAFNEQLIDLQRTVMLDATQNPAPEKLVIVINELRRMLWSESLRHGFAFGLEVVDRLWFERKSKPYLLTHNGLAIEINKIFREAETTSSGPTNIPWTLRLYADNFYCNTLTEDSDPNYKTINDNSDPIKPLIHSLCTELYANADTDTANFKRGYGIALRAYNRYAAAFEEYY